MAGLQTGQAPASPRTPLPAIDALLLALAPVAVLMPWLGRHTPERLGRAARGTGPELQARVEDQLRAQTKQRT